MINANAQSPKSACRVSLACLSGCCDRRWNRRFSFCRACGNVQFIVQHEDVFGQDFVKLANAAMAKPERFIYVIGLSSQTSVLAMRARPAAVKFDCALGGRAVFTRDVIEQPPASRCAV